MFNSFFGKYFQRAVKKGYNIAIQRSNKVNGVSGKEFNTTFNNMEKGCKDAFKVASTLIASTILAKRVIVPFIATPLAGKAENWMNKNEAIDKQLNSEKNK